MRSSLTHRAPSAASYVPKADFETERAAVVAQTNKLHACERELTAANVYADTVAADLEAHQRKNEALDAKLSSTRGDLQAGAVAMTQLQAELEHLQGKLAQQSAHFDELRQQSREEFANVSHQLLQRNGAALREDHARSLKTMLDPLRIKLHEFQEQVDRKFSEESKDKATLKTQIEHLTSLNQDLAAEARQLTLALKGDSKTQGDWGELQLERLLEAAGLHADAHFETQASFRASDGRQQRPDCIIRLPQDRCLVVDAKVSLTAYERFCEADTTDDRMHLAAHVGSIRAHIRGLSAKRYQDLYQINCPDYVMLFVPLEPAFIAAVRERPSLFTEALEANVVLVSPSTLLATMRTVAFIWQQDDQHENAQRIAQVGKKLYDKFVGFVEDMDSVGQQLDRAKDSYDAAMNKLSRSPKRGTTLLARAQELKSLGVASTKTLQD